MLVGECLLENRTMNFACVEATLCASIYLVVAQNTGLFVVDCADVACVRSI